MHALPIGDHLAKVNDLQMNFASQGQVELEPNEERNFHRLPRLKRVKRESNMGSVLVMESTSIGDHHRRCSPIALSTIHGRRRIGPVLRAHLWRLLARTRAHLAKSDAIPAPTSIPVHYRRVPLSGVIKMKTCRSASLHRRWNTSGQRRGRPEFKWRRPKPKFEVEKWLTQSIWRRG